MRRDLFLIVALFFTPAVATAAPDPVVVLRWDAVPEAAGYELEIAEDPGFAAPLVTTSADTPRYEWHALPDHPYWWRVRCRFSFGREGPWSGVKPIAAAVVPVSAAGPVDGGDQHAGEALEVPFLPQRAMREVRLEVAADRAFTNPVGEWRGAAPPASVALPGPGVWFWRLSGTDVLGRPVPPAEVRSIVVRLDAPRVIGPEAGAVTSPGTTFLAWEAVAGASAYLVEATLPDGTATRSDLSTTSLALEAMSPGSYAWRVRAVSPDGTPGFASARSSFRVEAPAAVSSSALVASLSSLVPPEPVVPPVPMHGALAALAGLRAAPGSGPLAGLELSARPFAGERARLALELTAFEARQTIAGDAATASVSARADVATLSVTGRQVFFADPLELELGAGPALSLAEIRVGPDRRLLAGIGGLALAGASVPAGGGRMFLRLQFGVGRLDAPIARLDPGGVAMLVGWRIER